MGVPYNVSHGTVVSLLPPLSMDSTNRDPFALPPIEKLREIERRQNERAKEIAERRAQQRRQSPNRESNAAEVIQKNYRGYRTRRTLQGYGLDPNTRWVEVRMIFDPFLFEQTFHRTDWTDYNCTRR